MSLPLDETLAVLRDHITDNAVLQAIAKDLAKTEREIKESRPHTKAAKTRLVALLRSDDPAVKRAAEAGVFIVSVPDSEETATYSGESLLSRLRKAVAAHNDAPKGKRRKAKVVIQTWFQAFTHLRAKTIKESGSTITVKQKGTPAELVVLEKEEVAPC